MACLRLLLAAALLAAWGPTALAATVRVFTSSPVAPGKFVTLTADARAAGFTLEVHYVERLSTPVGERVFDGADLVLFDTPRAHIEAFARERLAPALPTLARRPHLWLPATAPRAGGGLDTTLAQRLHAYYVNGGAANRRHLVQTLAAHLAGRDWAQLPAPQVFPAAGVYHPRLPQLVLPDVAAYLAWRGASPRQRPPVVAIAFHQQSVAAEQTGLIDDLVARVEAGGAMALPFYSPVMDADAVRRMVTVDGQVVADVVINTQITLNAEGRRREFDSLGLPVLQAMGYRRGDAAAWRADPQGVPLNDVPFYLAQAEAAGITDIQVTAATRRGDEQLEPIAEQAAAIAAKALRLVALQRKPAADKRVAVFFWNYPAGEKNLSASFLNLPRSLQATLAALQAAGYDTRAPGEVALIAQLQRLLEPAYRPPQDRAVLQALLRDNLAATLPVARYRQWLAGLPAEVQAQLQQAWGAPEQSGMVLTLDGQPHFVVPRLQLGHISLLPQPGRDERGSNREKAIYHASHALPTHAYLATYLWAREAFAADALVHFGTHGTQEWLPGKERGLSVWDWPHLAVGDVPVFYPYIMDNVGEATQAKRRGRAVIVSHLTPPFAPAGLHGVLTALHDRLHDWLAQGPGGVKDALQAEITRQVQREHLHRDMGWTEARLQQDFAGFIQQLHDHLHELALTAQPLGLHTFGQGAGEDARLATVLMMLGKPFWQAVAGPGEEADELLVADHQRLQQATPYRVLQAVLQAAPGAPLPAGVSPEQAAQARQWHQALGAQAELQALLHGLAGRHLATASGGDPLRSPDALPTGRNLVGFDPSRVPTPAAWAAGRQALDQLLAAHRSRTGRAPAKLAFTLWSVETMRHFGLLEAQALWALGVEPVWDGGGRVTGVRLLPRQQLGRPRVDVVLSATGLYRDHFPNVMKQLARAVELASQAADEADNPVATNSQRIRQQLQQQGVPAAEAAQAGATRLFSSESGRYGTGLDDAALATDTWKTQAEGDRKLATLYLQRMQFAYGPDDSRWGQAGVSTAGALNLYAEHLRGTEAAVLARSSNLYGMLTTDDPFQYLGGIGLAVRQLDGRAPELYISNLRQTGHTRVEDAAGFLAKELATRNFHPGYIRGLMAEGYAGTLQVLDGINNFAGWQSVAREIVRHDQWQAFMDVYVRDKHRLGLDRWFEQHNPHALAQSIERMLEAARQGQWQASAASVQALKARWQQLARRHGVRSDNSAFTAFVAAGYGLQQPRAGAAAPSKAAAAPPAPLPAPMPAPVPAPAPVQGLLLQRVQPARAASVALPWAALALLLATSAGGAWRARRHWPPRRQTASVFI